MEMKQEICHCVIGVHNAIDDKISLSLRMYYDIGIGCRTARHSVGLKAERPQQTE